MNKIILTDKDSIDTLMRIKLIECIYQELKNVPFSVVHSHVWLSKSLDKLGIIKDIKRRHFKVTK